MKKARTMLRRGWPRAYWEIKGVPRKAKAGLNSYGFTLSTGHTVGPNYFRAIFSKASLGEELLPSLEKLEEIITVVISADEMKDVTFEIGGVVERLLQGLRRRAEGCPDMTCQGGILTFKLKPDPRQGKELIEGFREEIARFIGA